MTYDESALLMQDQTFRGRIKVSCLFYATYIHGEAPGTAGHAARYRWAQEAYRQPDMVAAQMHSPVVMNAAVQAAGAAIEDAALQTAVESVVNTFI
jgi:hypothetical protein